MGVSVGVGVMVEVAEGVLVGVIVGDEVGVAVGGMGEGVAVGIEVDRFWATSSGLNGAQLQACKKAMKPARLAPFINFRRFIRWVNEV